MTRRPAIAGVFYVAAMAGYVYGIWNPSVGWGSDLAGLVLLAGLIAVHLTTGAIAGTFLAVFLPPVVVLLALPAGYPERGELPLWFGAALIQAPAAVVIAAGGMLARMWGAPVRGGPRQSRPPAATTR